MHGAQVELSAVNAPTGGDGGVAARRQTARVHRRRDGRRRRRARARIARALRTVLSDEAFVDTCAVVGAFNVFDRIADATGIPLDAGLAASSGELRVELDLARFASAANTPGAGAD